MFRIKLRDRWLDYIVTAAAFQIALVCCHFFLRLGFYLLEKGHWWTLLGGTSIAMSLPFLVIGFMLVWQWAYEFIPESWRRNPPPIPGVHIVK